MNVFISWSGPRSRAVAELLRDWIKCVLQATRPWISTRDLDRGSMWFNDIGALDAAATIQALRDEAT